MIAQKWAQRHNEYLEKLATNSQLNWPQNASGPKSLERVKRMAKIEQTIVDAELQDLVRKLLDFNPKTRLTARQAMSHPFFASIAQDYNQPVHKDHSEIA